MITLDAVMILARTIYGEARGEDDTGRRAVAHVIINRWRHGSRKDHSIAAACLRWRQFSAWNEDDPNRAKMESVMIDSATFRRCVVSAFTAIDEDDFTKRALHYHTRGVEPSWSQGHEPCFQTTGHLFFNDID